MTETTAGKTSTDHDYVDLGFREISFIGMCGHGFVAVLFDLE